MRSKTSRTTECPRCGYDLGGTVASWGASCPMVGTCTECGLEFEWSEVLNPIFRIPAWFLEHPYRRVWRTFMPTYVRTLRPWKFWRSVRLWFPVMPWRLAQYVAEMVLVLHVCLAYTTIALSYGFDWPMQVLSPPSVVWLGEVGRVLLFPYRAWHFQVYYALPTGGMGWSPSKREIPTVFDAAGLMLSLWCVLLPLSFVLLRRSMRTAKVRRRHLLRAFVYNLSPMPWVIGGYCVFMGISEWWYSNAWGPLFAFDLAWNLRTWIESVVPLPIAVACVVGAWLLWSWYSIVRRYFQIPNALGVAAGMLTVSGLLSVLIVVAIARPAFLELLRAIGSV